MWHADNSKVINSLKKCKVVVRYGVGYDNIDIKAASKKIVCLNTPDYGIDEVDTAVAMILSFTRKLRITMTYVKITKMNGNKMY